MTGYELLQKLSKCDLNLPVIMDCNDMKYDVVSCLMETEGKEEMITLYSEEADK